jgi:AbrB family looped-hinge helix DNA binding protein
MNTTRLSSKGQVVLPRAVRDAYGWTEGTEFSVEDSSGGILLRPKKPFPATQTSEVYGRLKYAGPAKTLTAMGRGVRQMLRNRFGSGK